MPREKPQPIDTGFNWLNSLLSTLQNDPFGGLAILPGGLGLALKNVPAFSPMKGYGKLLSSTMTDEEVAKQIIEKMKNVGGPNVVEPEFLASGADIMTFGAGPKSVLKIAPRGLYDETKEVLKNAPGDIFLRPEQMGNVTRQGKNLFDFYSQPRALINNKAPLSDIDLLKAKAILRGYRPMDMWSTNIGYVKGKPYIIDAGSLMAEADLYKAIDIINRFAK